MGIDGSASAAAAGSPGGFLSWEQWAYVASIFSAFVLAGLIPFTRYVSNKYKAMKAFNTNKQNENISKIATKVSDTVENKLNEKIDEQSQAITDVSKSMEKLSRKLDDGDKQNKAILSTVRTLTKDFHDFRNKQIEINAKVSYMDDVFRQRLSFVRNIDLYDDSTVAQREKEKYFDNGRNGNGNGSSH